MGLWLYNGWGRGERGEALDSRAIPTGFPGLDQALGVGGIPRGRITEIFGGPSAGKLSLAMHVLAQAQDQGAVAGFVDPLKAVDAFYATQVGVDLGRVVILCPNDARDAFEMAYRLVSTNALSLVILDLPLSQPSQAWSHQTMTEGIRRLKGVLSKSNTGFLVVNRLSGSEDGVESPACRALRHFASIRMRVTRSAWIYRGQDIVGCRSKVEVVKNKLAPPYRSAEIDILYEIPRSCLEHSRDL